MIDLMNATLDNYSDAEIDAGLERLMDDLREPGLLARSPAPARAADGDEADTEAL